MRIKLFKSCVEARDAYREFINTSESYKGCDRIVDEAQLFGRFSALFDLICELGLEETYYEWQLAEEEK